MFYGQYRCHSTRYGFRVEIGRRAYTFSPARNHRDRLARVATAVLDYAPPAVRREHSLTITDPRDHDGGQRGVYQGSIYASEPIGQLAASVTGRPLAYAVETI